MNTQVIVKVIGTEKTGILSPQKTPFMFSVQTEDEALTVMSEDVEVVNTTEFSVDSDPQKCGLGKGAGCCIYLASSGVFECARGTALQSAIDERFAKGLMGANYRPTKPYPDCRY